MKLLVSLILFIAGAQITPPTIVPTTWYIRSDGGNLSQCTGQTDAAYVAGMATKNCALNDYRLLAFSGTYTATMPAWRVQGGDTIRIHAGQYRLGYNGPNSGDHDGLAVAGDPFGAAMPPIPSGTAANPTKIIGDGSATTQLFGGHGAGNLISLSGSAFVQISGLELTDHSQCTRVGAAYAAPVVGCITNYPMTDDYAGTGIITNTGTHDITLTDLNIHGFTSRGIIGPIGGDITADHVRIAFNGGAGWDFDDGRATKSTSDASVHASYLTVEGNGCNEEFPLVHAFPALVCFDQGSGGYGDGVGTPGTPLNFTCDHCTFDHNTQDGLDLLHVSGSLIKVTNSTSYANEGQQWKFGAMQLVDFENNTWVHNCSRMGAAISDNSTFFKYLNTLCRAAGDGIAFTITDGGTYIFKNNSYAGYGSTTYDIDCAGSCTKSNITFENNLHVGYKNPNGGQLPAVFYMEKGVPANPFVVNSNNVYYNMRTLPAGGVGTDPHLAGEPVWTGEASLDAVDFHLTATSTNAISQGLLGANIGALGLPAVLSTPSTAFTITLNCTQTGAAISCATK